jgi:YHS domain-containing protein
MWRLIVLAILFIIIYFLVRSAVRGLFEKKKDVARVASTGPTSESGLTSEMVQDPICGMFVSKEGAYFIRNAERTHFFCSESCRDTYQKKLASV